MGTMYVLVPKVRKGGYIPFFVTERKRSEQAQIQVIQEAFINGVSTRKIERLAKNLGIESISASQVSQINKELNQQVEEFRNRPLESTYPVIWIDALYEKILTNHRVSNMAVLVVCGINLAGKREILAVEPMYEESEASYTALFDKLKRRGLKTVWLAVSDAHSGLMAIEILETGLEDSLQYYQNKEIRRRSRVVGIFPSMDSYVRLISCYLIEYAEDWETSRRYVRQEILQQILTRRTTLDTIN
jgi:transposase-like protein